MLCRQMTTKAQWMTLSITLALCSPRVLAQAPPAPASAPASAPATTQRARYELTLPPGMVKVVVGERQAICDAVDEPWVKQVLTEVGPATRPTTLASDLLTSLSAKRAELV